MDIVTTSLEALIQRATCNQNQCPDTAAIDAFCGLICKEPETAQSATRFITAKVHSLQQWEALQALNVLDECMRRCGSNFHAEVGKFRFLNELIKLVSPKYNGAYTPEPVKQRVLELMQSWTMFYPREFKIKEAYEMLKKQGVVTEQTMRQVKTPQKSQEQNIVPPRSEDSIFQDTEKSRLLQKLLQSKNPNDIQAANSLIKTMVKEAERKVEIKSKHLSELEAAHNNARLLSEMLTSYSNDVSSPQDLELITELQSSCLRYRPNIQKLMSEVHDDDRLISELSAVNCELTEVLEKYSTVIIQGLPSTSDNGSNLLDLSTPSEDTPTLNLAMPLLPNHHSAMNTDGMLASNDDTDLLSLSLPQSQPSLPPQPQLSDLTALSDILSPVSLPALQVPVLPSKGAEQSGAKSAMAELDALSDSLLRQSLSQPTQQKPLLNQGKVSMNQLSVSNQESPVHNSNPSSICNNSVDLLMSSTEDLLAEPDLLNGDTLSVTKTEMKTESPVVVKPIGDITVPLETIKPGSLSPLNVLDERGISVTIHFGRESPRADVSVFVVTTTSKSQFPITDYLFQAIVPKGCRMRLQPPSSTELPAHNPFLPPAAITQVMLIATPNKESILLRVVVSFTMDDETITEMKDVAQFPLPNL